MARSEGEGEIDGRTVRGLVQAVFYKQSSVWLCGGVLIFISGAANQVLYTGFKLGQPAGIIAMVVGVGALAWAGYLARLELRTASSKDDRILSIDWGEYRDTATITPPKPENTVPARVALEGTLDKGVPHLVELWLFSVVGTSYFPQIQIVNITKSRTNWTWDVIWQPGEEKEEENVQLFFVGANGQKLMKLYKHLNDKFAVPAKKPWEGIPSRDFTDDIIEAASKILSIRLRPPA